MTTAELEQAGKVASGRSAGTTTKALVYHGASNVVLTSGASR